MVEQHFNQQGAYVKNLPIVGKMLTVLGVFGVFVIAVAFYATSQLTFINSQYTQLDNGQIAAREDLMAGTATIHAMASHISQLMLDTTDTDQQNDLSSLASYKSRFEVFMDQAAAASPNDAAEIEGLKSRTLQVFDGECANSI